MRSQRHSAPEHEGQVLILVAIASLILFGFAALAVDAGLALSERRGAQNAADAASLAVTRAMLVRGQNAAEDEATIAAYLEANGYPDMEFEWEYTTNPDGVRVDVEHEVPRIFLGAFYDGDWSVGAGASAALEPVPKDYALLTLSESGPGVNMIGNVNIEIEGGSAMSNSSMECNGNSEFYAEQSVDSHQGFSTTGNCEFSGGVGINPSAPKVDDPLEGTPGPTKPSVPSGLSPGQCDASGSSVVCTPGYYDSNQSFNGNIDITFQPGDYHFDNADLSIKGNITMEFSAGEYDFYMENSDISLSGNTDLDMDPADNSDLFFYFDDSTFDFSGNTSLNMASGVYYFDGEDFGVSGNQEVTGDDLLLYFDDGASFNHSGNAEFNLTASDTPLYSGMPPNMLFFAAPGSESVLDLRGNTGIYFDGITYMPDGRIDFRGNPSGVWANGQVIVNDVEFRGNGTGVIQYQEYAEIRVPTVFLTQ